MRQSRGRGKERGGEQQVYRAKEGRGKERGGEQQVYTAKEGRNDGVNKKEHWETHEAAIILLSCF